MIQLEKPPIVARGWRCRKPSGSHRRVVNERLLPRSRGEGDNKGTIDGGPRLLPGTVLLEPPVAVENPMLTGRSNDNRQSNPRPVQFRLRLLFVWVTGLAILAALITGSFGPLLQFTAVSIFAIVLGSIAASWVIGGPWIALVWFLKQITGWARRQE